MCFVDSVDKFVDKNRVSRYLIEVIWDLWLWISFYVERWEIYWWFYVRFEVGNVLGFVEFGRFMDRGLKKGWCVDKVAMGKGQLA